MQRDTTLLHKVLRKDFATFLQFVMSVVSPGDTLKFNWHIDAIIYQLQAIERGEIDRLLVTIPPRHLKTITISIAWVCWRLGREPWLRFVCVSYSNELAYDISRSARQVMEHPTFRAAFPECVLKRSAEQKLETTRGGFRFATSVGGAVTGFGGDIFIVDDPIKAEDSFSAAAREKVASFHSSTLVTRPNDKEHAKFIVVMQRLHQHDLAGLLIQSGDYEHLNLPAIAQEDESVLTWSGGYYCRKAGEPIDPNRESLKTLAVIERAMGPFSFAAQYLQKPRPSEGLMIRPEWLRYRPGVPLIPQGGDVVVQSWDCAISDGANNDWSVCITAILGQDGIDVIDVARERLVFPDLEQKVIALALRFKASTVLIEDAASGQQLLQVLTRKSIRGFPTPVGIRPQGDKVARLARASSEIQAGVVYLPTQASWAPEFLSELLAFPGGRFDDQVDALSQLVNWRVENPLLRTVLPYDGFTLDTGPFAGLGDDPPEAFQDLAEDIDYDC